MLAAAANYYDWVCAAYGQDAALDVYVCIPLNNASVFYFVGEVGRMTVAATGTPRAACLQAHSIPPRVRPLSARCA